MGNLISDVAGIGTAGTVEQNVKRFLGRSSVLTAKQRESTRAHRSSYKGDVKFNDYFWYFLVFKLLEFVRTLLQLGLCYSLVSYKFGLTFNKLFVSGGYSGDDALAFV